MTFSNVLLNIGYVTFVLSPTIRGEARLRALMIGASSLFVTWGLLEGLWNSVAWNLVFVSMHIAQFVLMKRREVRSRAAHMIDAMKPVLGLLPAGTSDVDAMTLFETATRRWVDDETIVLAGITPHKLSLVLSGEVEVSPNHPAGDEAVRLGTGALIGEMSYLTGEPPRRTVNAVGRVELIEFPTAAIEALRTASPTAHTALLTAMGSNLTSKIAGHAPVLGPRPRREVVGQLR